MFFAIKKKLFTVIEMLIVIGMIASGLLVMYAVISKGLDFVDYTRKKLVAINLARAGMEAVYNIRDTNWTRWSGKRDKCWLKVDPLVDDGGDGCENDSWFASGHYVLKLAKQGDQYYWMLSGVSVGLNIFDGLDSNDKIFALCQASTGWYACPGQNNFTSEGKFFREIIGLGLLDKKNDTDLTCSAGDDGSCGDSTAKEFRFCSIVQFVGNARGQVKMCGVLTNFKE